MLGARSGGGSEAWGRGQDGAAVRSPRETPGSSRQVAGTADRGLRAGEEASDSRRRW